MQLRPVDTASVDLVAHWLAQKENRQWLDFGSEVQDLTPVSLMVMVQKPTHLLRTFTADGDTTDIGLVALSNTHKKFRTAMLWYVLGDKRYAGQGYTTRAVQHLLTLGFSSLGLEAINAWVVEENVPSVKVLMRNNFRRIGRQRKSHYIDDQPYDRLLFDLLACEHKELHGE